MMIRTLFVTLVLAADALGAENVTGVSMPARYSSEASWADAQQLADNLGIDFLTDDVRFVEDDWESPTLGAHCSYSRH